MTTNSSVPFHIDISSPDKAIQELDLRLGDYSLNYITDEKAYREPNNTISIGRMYMTFTDIKDEYSSWAEYLARDKYYLVSIHTLGKMSSVMTGRVRAQTFHDETNKLFQ